MTFQNTNTCSCKLRGLPGQLSTDVQYLTLKFQKWFKLIYELLFRKKKIYIEFDIWNIYMSIATSLAFLAGSEKHLECIT